MRAPRSIVTFAEHIRELPYDTGRAISLRATSSRDRFNLGLMPDLVLPGFTLHYEMVGARGPALVILGGMSQSTVNWRSQGRALAERFCVVTYDARGQGRSTLGDTPLDLDTHVEDLAALLAHLDLGQVALAGFSHGARVALGFAARYPELVERLILTSIGAGADPLRDAVVRSWCEVLRVGGVEALAWCVMPAIFGAEFIARSEAHLSSMVRASVGRNTAAGLGALLSMTRAMPDAAEDAERVRCPALLITSDADLVVSRESASRLSAALPDCRHEVVRGSGHTIPVERPERWRQLVVSAFERCGARNARPKAEPVRSTRPSAPNSQRSS